MDDYIVQRIETLIGEYFNEPPKKIINEYLVAKCYEDITYLNNLITTILNVHKIKEKEFKENIADIEKVAVSACTMINTKQIAMKKNKMWIEIIIDILPKFKFFKIDELLKKFKMDQVKE